MSERICQKTKKPCRFGCTPDYCYIRRIEIPMAAKALVAIDKIVDSYIEAVDNVSAPREAKEELIDTIVVRLQGN